MYFSQTLPVVALAAGAVAVQHTIQVANQQGALIYTPNTVTAAVGDTVQFVFNPKNHTVTEAAFDSPCRPLEGSSAFNSGFRPQTAGAAMQDTFTYTVADSNPHWFYCAQGKHCESGMVGVINPPASGNTIDAFTAAAKLVNGSVAAAQAPVNGVLGTIAATSTTNTTTTNGTTTTTASGNQVTSFSQVVVSTASVYTDASGKTQTTEVVQTSSVAVLISSQAGAKGQIVGFGAAVAGIAAMFL